MARKFSGSVVIRCGAKTCTMRTIGCSGLLDFAMEVLELWIATEFVVFRGLLVELGGAMAQVRTAIESNRPASYVSLIRLKYVSYNLNECVASLFKLCNGYSLGPTDEF
mgnify:CR=1 FL=1